MNPFRFLQNKLGESLDSPPFSLFVNCQILREFTWILITLFRRIFAKMDSQNSRQISNPDIGDAITLSNSEFAL